MTFIIIVSFVILALLLTWLTKRSEKSAKLISHFAFLIILVALLSYMTHLTIRFTEVFSSLLENFTVVESIIEILNHKTTYEEFTKFATLLGLISIVEQNRKKNKIPNEQLLKIRKLEDKNEKLESLLRDQEENLEKDTNNVESIVKSHDRKSSAILVGLFTVSLIALFLRKNNR